MDFLGGLNQLQQLINNGAFANQYEFEASLQALIYSVHDDHTDLVAGILAVFSFGSPYGIASVSIDGQQAPKVYLSDDLTQSQIDGTWQPSAISQIDGQDVVTFLTQFAAQNSIGSLEPHADWNLLFDSAALDIQAGVNVFGGGATFYPGDTLTMVLENGTQIGPTPWLAVYNYPSPTGPLETGGDFYNFFVLGFYPASFDSTSTDDGSSSSSAAPSSAAASSSFPSAAATSSLAPSSTSWDNPAYPTSADVAQPDLSTYGGGFISGYFFHDSSIAVLSIPSFQETGIAVNTFSSTIGEFLSSSKAAGMEKVVIDLQQNFGGDSLLAFDAFKQFFPGLEPFGGSRMRAFDATNEMGEAITNYWDQLTVNDTDYYDLVDDEWMASDRINAETSQNFTSWAEFYGPHLFNGDNFTTVVSFYLSCTSSIIQMLMNIQQQYDLSSVIFDTNSVEDYDEDFVVYGEASPPNTTQPYAAEDIIILSDGLCSSTCALFMEMFHHEAGVRTVVAGGRPSYGPQQAPALSRGARAMSSDVLDSNIEFAQEILQALDDPNSNFSPNRTEALDVYVTFAGINLRDQIRKVSDVPLQFVYEAADCRIFYTPQTWYNYTALWHYAANAIWSNPGLCVKNSTGYATTNVTDTTGPPAEVLTKPVAVQAPVKLGSIIMNMLSSSTPDSAPILDGLTKVNQKSLTGTPCPDGTCDVIAPGYYCYELFKKCETQNVVGPDGTTKKVQKLVTVPSCVPACSKIDDVCPTVPGYCFPVKGGSGEVGGHNVDKGFCPGVTPSCGRPSGTGKVNVNGPRPVKGNGGGG